MSLPRHTHITRPLKVSVDHVTTPPPCYELCDCHVDDNDVIATPPFQLLLAQSPAGYVNSRDIMTQRLGDGE